VKEFIAFKKFPSRGIKVEEEFHSRGIHSIQKIPIKRN
jgi:hypothetical protein